MFNLKLLLLRRRKPIKVTPKNSDVDIGNRLDMNPMAVGGGEVDEPMDLEQEKHLVSDLS